LRLVDYDTGRALSEVAVHLDGWSGISDADGLVSVELPAGSYWLKIRPEFREPWTERVEVREPETDLGVRRLRRAAYFG
jgi:hypothetical protein